MAGNIFCLGNTGAGSLQDIECRFVDKLIGSTTVGGNPNSITQTVNQQATQIGCGEELKAFSR